jgi:hypothetical protein
MKDFRRELILLLVLIISFQVFGETRTRIAVIDTGIRINEMSKPFLCKDGHKDFTEYGILDANGHGYNIAGLIARGMNNKTHCITVIKFYNKDKENTRVGIEDSLTSAYNYVLKLNPKYINLSISGEEFSQFELNFIKEMLRRGAIITVAAGNNNKDLSKRCVYFPACYNLKHNF